MTQEDNKLVAERRRKLNELRETGFAFPSDFRRSAQPLSSMPSMATMAMKFWNP